MTAANPASPNLARVLNDRMALDLMVEHGGLSAPQLRKLTGLSRPSVSDLLERLQDNGLVEVVGESGARRRGPNAKLYGLVADRAHVAGIDLRGERIHVLLADLAGVELARASRALDARQSLAELMRRAVADAARKAEVPAGSLHTVAVAAPGAVDAATGELLPGHSFPGWDGRLLPELVDALDVPIVLESESNVAGTVELRQGRGRGRQELAVLWLDRSVGASVVMGGRLRQGVSGGAGELGKLALPGAPPPRAGRSGGLQALASERAVTELAVEFGFEASASAAVAAACREPEPSPFLGELALRIGYGALALAAVVDPGLIVLAGSVGAAGGERLADLVEAQLGEWDAAPTEVRPSEAVEAPILAGALLSALDVARDDIFGSPDLESFGVES